jgi:hypothetical protein
MDDHDIIGVKGIIMIDYGDEKTITLVIIGEKIKTIIKTDNDHVQMDTTYQVMENGDY